MGGRGGVWVGCGWVCGGCVVVWWWCGGGVVWTGGTRRMFIHDDARMQLFRVAEQAPGVPATRGALDNEELFVIEGSKNDPWRSTPEKTGGARKMPHFTAKNPSSTS